MARPLKRKMVARTFLCENGHRFTARVEYLGHDVEEPGGSQTLVWRIGKVRGVTCPECHTDGIELVEE